MWNQQDRGNITSTPTGVQVQRPNKAAYFIQINVSLSADFPIWLEEYMFIGKLKNKNPSSGQAGNSEYLKDSHV